MTTIRVWQGGGYTEYVDSKKFLYDYTVTDGHLILSRMAPDEQPQPFRVLPPGEWIEVVVDYDD